MHHNDLPILFFELIQWRFNKWNNSIWQINEKKNYINPLKEYSMFKNKESF